MENIVIIADDLTGAADTGAQFARFFDETVLVAHHRLSHALKTMENSVSRAVTVYTSSRALDADSARKRVTLAASFFAQSKPGRIYKKVDSCLRGNIGAETEAVMDSLGFELSFIAPAFPEMGRTTVNDIHQVYGIPVGRTEFSRDPVSPVTGSRLSKIVGQQSRYPVGHVGLDFLQADETRLQKEIDRLAGFGIRHIAFDCVTEDHMDRIARLLPSSVYRILPVGSAGMAAGLGRLLPQRKGFPKNENRVLENGHFLLVSGTASPVAKKQIEALVQTYVYEQIVLETDILADRKKKDILSKKASDAGLLLSGQNVVVQIEPSATDACAEKKPDQAHPAELIVEGLGFFVAQVLNRRKPEFLFVTGGDTADAVLTALNCGGIRIIKSMDNGMVEGELLGGPLDGLAIITKAGAFGREDALVAMHQRWEKTGEGL